MKQKTKLAIPLTGLLLLSGCQSNTTAEVVTTSYFAYDFVRAIADETLNYEMLIKPGIDLHSSAPTPREMEAINNAKLFIHTSDVIDPWATEASFKSEHILNLGDLFEGANDLVGDEHHNEDEHDHEHEHGHDHGAIHYWTSPANAIKAIEHISELLSEIYPDNAHTFNNNGENYTGEILNASNSFKGQDLDFSKPLFYIGHNALEAFEHYFDLNIITMVEGVRPDHDVTGHELTTIIEAIKAANAHYVFVEELSSPNFVNTIIAELAKEDYQLTVKELHGYHGITQEEFDNGITYLDLLERNLTYISEALQ